MGLYSGFSLHRQGNIVRILLALVVLGLTVNFLIFSKLFIWVFSQSQSFESEVLVPKEPEKEIFSIQTTTSPDPEGVHFAEEISDNLLVQDELRNWGSLTYSPNRLLCAVPTSFIQNRHRWMRIAKFWGSLCDTLVFVLASNEPELDKASHEMLKASSNNTHIVVVDVKLSSDQKQRNIWEKVLEMWKTLWKDFSDKAEWFIKVDDDTFLALENLRRFLRFYNPRIPRYFGHTFYFRWRKENIVFNSGVTYVLSRESLLRIGSVLRDIPDGYSGEHTFSHRCVRRAGASEDVAMGICLRSIGIQPDRTEDEFGRERFLPFQYEGHINYVRKDQDWFWKGKPRFIGSEKNCCVDEMDIISSHAYKGKIQDENLFIKLHEKYHDPELLRKLREEGEEEDLKNIPPAPEKFLIDSDLEFEIDSFRNSIPYPADQEVWKGWQEFYRKQSLRS